MLLELGLADSEHVEILSGLDAGDEVITVGQVNLRDGARVRLPRPEGEEPDDSEAAAEARDADEPQDGDEG